MGAPRIDGMGRNDLIAEITALRSALGAIVGAADEMLGGGEPTIRHAEQCSECGCGGAGALREALDRARPMVGR